MKTTHFQFIIALLFAAILVSCNNQGARENETDGSDSIEMNENATSDGILDGDNNNVQDFMMEAAQSGLFEVEMARYAQQSATNPRVKNFAAMMVRDHTQANDELKALAAQKNITIPTTLDEKHTDKMNDIRENRGSEFDKKYMNEMVDMHESDIDKFRRQSDNSEDPEVRTFATKYLPVLIMHHDSAQNINDALK